MRVKANLFAILISSILLPGTGYATIVGDPAFNTPFATINPGDTIQITATLSTTDPDENGEGEPIVFTADGSIFAVDPTYAVPATFTYTAPPVLIAPGSPIPTTSIGYYIQGADGDETATLGTVLNPLPNPKTPAQIAQWTNDAYIWGLIGGGVGTAGAVGCPFTGPAIVYCGAGAGGVAGLSAMLAAYYAKLAADPIDTNYMVIATPATVTLPPDITIGTSLASDEAKAIATIAALITSVNRYEGALAAGDAFWEEQQLTAINQYVTELNALGADFGPDIQSFVQQLKTIGLSLTLTSSEVLEFESDVPSTWLSPDLISIFNQLGVTSSDLQIAEEDLIVQDTDTISGQYPDVLTNDAAQLSPTSAVPEPGTLGLLIMPLLMLLVPRRVRSFGKWFRSVSPIQRSEPRMSPDLIVI